MENSAQSKPIVVHRGVELHLIGIEDVGDGSMWISDKFVFKHKGTVVGTWTQLRRPDEPVEWCKDAAVPVIDYLFQSGVLKDEAV